MTRALVRRRRGDGPCAIQLSMEMCVPARSEPEPYRGRTLNRVQWRDRVLRFRQEIAVRVSQEGRYWLMEYGPLGILAYAQTPAQAERDFGEEFLVLWDAIAQAPDETLAPDAPALKQALLSLIAAEASPNAGSEDS